MNAVTRGRWRSFKKRHMGLVLEKKELGVEKGKELERVVVGPRNEGNGLASCGAKERRTRKGCLAKLQCEGAILRCGKVLWRCR